MDSTILSEMSDREWQISYDIAYTWKQKKKNTVQISLFTKQKTKDYVLRELAAQIKAGWEIK